MRLEAEHAATGRAAALEWLWDRVIEHVAAMRLSTGERYEACTDDVMLRDASAADCLGWLDDCQARLGCDVTAARAEMMAYLAVRDGIPGEPAVGAAIAPALLHAMGRLHRFHPVLVGLRVAAEGNKPPTTDSASR